MFKVDILVGSLVQYIFYSPDIGTGMTYATTMPGTLAYRVVANVESLLNVPSESLYYFVIIKFKYKL